MMISRIRTATVDEPKGKFSSPTEDSRRRTVADQGDDVDLGLERERQDGEHRAERVLQRGRA